MDACSITFLSQHFGLLGDNRFPFLLSQLLAKPHTESCHLLQFSSEHPVQSSWSLTTALFFQVSPELSFLLVTQHTRRLSHVSLPPPEASDLLWMSFCGHPALAAPGALCVCVCSLLSCLLDPVTPSKSALWRSTCNRSFILLTLSFGLPIHLRILQFAHSCLCQIPIRYWSSRASSFL